MAIPGVECNFNATLKLYHVNGEFFLTKKGDSAYWRLQTKEEVRQRIRLVCYSLLSQTFDKMYPKIPDTYRVKRLVLANTPSYDFSEKIRGKPVIIAIAVQVTGAVEARKDGDFYWVLKLNRRDTRPARDYLVDDMNRRLDTFIGNAFRELHV